MSSSAMQLVDSFAIGNIFINPNSGLLPANPTPFELKTISEISLDYKGKNVALRGQYLVPVDARIADVEFTGKFTIGTSSLNQLNNLLFAGTLNTAVVDNIVPDEAATPAEAGSPPSGLFLYQVAGHTTFVEDLGVSAQASSAQFERVATSEDVIQAGQYYVDDEGSYSFFDDTPVFISYVNTVDTGASLSIPNNLQGQSPQFELAAWIPASAGATAGYNGYRFFACRATSCKLLAGKNNDFNKWEVDFSVYCPVNAQVGELIQTVI
jgi:hypothetical protein